MGSINEGKKKQALRRDVYPKTMRGAPQNDMVGLPKAAPCLVVGDACIGTPASPGFWFSANQLRTLK